MIISLLKWISGITFFVKYPGTFFYFYILANRLTGNCDEFESNKLI